MFNSVALAQDSRRRWTFTLQASTNRYVARAGELIRYRERDRRAAQNWLNFPVSGVSFDDAREYARWMSRTGRVPGARLCSDHEWERAARGADLRLWPHGDQLDLDDINRDVTYGRRPGGFGPDEVGSHPASESPFQVSDLAGNAWEWTSDAHRPEAVVTRGGGWYQGAVSSQIPNRELAEPSHRDPFIGFRICADVPEVLR
jgi:formylglycine-generating enzyme required for sulfatase activity